MQRAHAMLVILALMATPMALLARSGNDGANCICLCSMLYKSHDPQAQRSRGKAMCGHCPGQNRTCAMNAQNHPPDLGLNTMMAPTAPSLHVTLRTMVTSARLRLLQSSQFAPRGFLSVPFEPPRS